MVEEVNKMWIGISILTLALSIGLFLVKDLLREQQRTSSQDNRQTNMINTIRQR